jgi:arylsulfatase A-like enzyme
MNYFENSVRVPLLVSYPQWFAPHRVSSNVSTLDILPTMCDLVGTKPAPFLPMDGVSLLPHLEGRSADGHDEVFAEYTGEGTVRPLMMIRRAKWKYVTCPADGSQLYDLEADPLELVDLVKSGAVARDEKVRRVFEGFEREARERWDFDAITKEVLLSQRKRRLVWGALTKGRFTSWDYNPEDDGREK